MLAIPKGIQIAFQSAPLSHAIMNYGSAWDLLCQADMPNLGLCLDALDALTNHEPNDELDMLDPDMIFLVQLADRMAKSVADQRVFPGEGEHSTTLANMVTVLHRLGYRGDYNLAVWHDDSNQIPAFQVAQRAQQAALWLGQDVLHRSVPLPNQIRLKRKKVV
jgi:sugar phosphate isomerase/epimerase